MPRFLLSEPFFQFFFFATAFENRHSTSFRGSERLLLGRKCWRGWTTFRATRSPPTGKQIRGGTGSSQPKVENVLPFPRLTSPFKGPPRVPQMQGSLCVLRALYLEFLQVRSGMEAWVRQTNWEKAGDHVPRPEGLTSSQRLWPRLLLRAYMPECILAPPLCRREAVFFTRLALGSNSQLAARGGACRPGRKRLIDRHHEQYGLPALRAETTSAARKRRTTPEPHTIFRYSRTFSGQGFLRPAKSTSHLIRSLLRVPHLLGSLFRPSSPRSEIDIRHFNHSIRRS